MGVPAGRIEQLLIGIKLFLRDVAGGGALRIGGGFDTLEERQVFGQQGTVLDPVAEVAVIDHAVRAEGNGLQRIVTPDVDDEQLTGVRLVGVILDAAGGVDKVQLRTGQKVVVFLHQSGICGGAVDLVEMAGAIGRDGGIHHVKAVYALRIGQPEELVPTAGHEEEQQNGGQHSYADAAPDDELRLFLFCHGTQSFP